MSSAKPETKSRDFCPKSYSGASLIAEAVKKHPLWLFSDFRKLFAGRLVSAVGDKFFAIALSWWIISEGGANSKMHLGFLMAVNFLPVVLFGPFLGALADRTSRKTCMLWADALRFAIVAALAAALYFGALRLWLLYALCFLVSAFIPLFEAAENSALVDITDQSSLPAATAADSYAVQFSNVLGSALGSVLLAAIGVAGAFALNAASFLVSFALVLLISADLRPRGGGGHDYKTELRDGLRYIISNRPLLSLLCAVAAINFFASPVLLIMPMLVKFVINESVSWLAIFEVCFALGSGLTALALSFKSGFRRTYELFFISVALFAAAFALMAATSDKYLLCALLFVCGGAIALGNVVVMVLFQLSVPDGMKGRFFAALTAISYAVIPLSLSVTGFASEWFSLGKVMLFDAAGAGLLSLAILVLPRLTPTAKK